MRYIILISLYTKTHIILYQTININKYIFFKLLHNNDFISTYKHYVMILKLYLNIITLYQHTSQQIN